MLNDNIKSLQNIKSQTRGLLAKAMDYNTSNAIEESDGVFSINKNLECNNVEVDPYFKSLVDTVLGSSKKE